MGVVRFQDKRTSERAAGAKTDGGPLNIELLDYVRDLSLELKDMTERAGFGELSSHLSRAAAEASRAREARSA